MSLKDGKLAKTLNNFLSLLLTDFDRFLPGLFGRFLFSGSLT